jgi:serine O-acetyltransferase
MARSDSSATLDALRRDIDRCGNSRGERLREVFFNTGFWAVASYRLRRKMFLVRGPKPLRMILSLTGMILKTLTEVITHVEIPPSVSIGPGFYIAHTGTVVFNSSASLGANCTIATNVVIGHARGGGRGGCPQIGDRVYIGPNAVLIGPITVGEDALIAPGAIVIRSVEPRAVVAGNPAKQISSKGSFELIEYTGMHSDPARLASLAGM